VVGDVEHDALDPAVTERAHRQTFARRRVGHAHHRLDDRESVVGRSTDAQRDRGTRRDLLDHRHTARRARSDLDVEVGEAADVREIRHHDHVALADELIARHEPPRHALRRALEHDAAGHVTRESTAHGAEGLLDRVRRTPGDEQHPVLDAHLLLGEARDLAQHGDESLSGHPTARWIIRRDEPGFVLEPAKVPVFVRAPWIEARQEQPIAPKRRPGGTDEVVDADVGEIPAVLGRNRQCQEEGGGEAAGRSPENP
jgi:hypothetical protein